MSWRDVFKDLTGGFPLRIDRNEHPFILQPQSSTGVNASSNPFVLAGSSTGSVTFQVPNDCVIEIDQWNARSSHTNWPTNMGFLVNIYWGNRDLQLTQSPTPAELIFGSAARPGQWGLRPWIISTGSNAQGFGQLQIDMTNELTTTNSIYFALLGWRTKRS